MKNTPNNSIYEKVLSWEQLSFDERLSLVSDLVSDKVQKILLKEMAIAIASNERKVDVTLTAKQCTDPDKNIAKFVWGMWAQEISVTSDFPCSRAWESYQWTTKIKFRI